MKHKIILEIKKVAAEIDQSNSFNTKYYKDLLCKLHDKFVILDYLETNINSLTEESSEDQIEFADTVGEESKEEDKLVEKVEIVQELISSEEIEEEPEVEKIEEQIEDDAPTRLRKLREFEDKLEAVGGKEVKKSLHDELKKSTVNIGLNDRIAFVKILFDGNQQDFNRVLSQVNSYNNLEEVRDFINNYVKPDHNWEEHQEYSERFIEIIESKFE